MKRPREAILTGQPRQKRELERERRLAAAEERTRIVRDLHDSAAHAINVILVHAGGARLIQERDPAAVAHALATIEDVARETIGEIGRLIRNRRAEGQPTARSRVRPGSSRYRHSPSVTASPEGPSRCMWPAAPGHSRQGSIRPHTGERADPRRLELRPDAGDRELWQPGSVGRRNRLLRARRAGPWRCPCSA